MPAFLGEEGVKRKRRESNHSPPSSPDVKNAWSCTSTPYISAWRRAYLSTRDNSISTVSLGESMDPRGYLPLVPLFLDKESEHALAQNYRMFHLKRTVTTTQEPLHAQKRQNQRQHRILTAVSCCCNWCTAWNPYDHNFSSYGRSLSICHRHTFEVSRTIVTSQCIVVLFGTSLSRQTSLNASWTAPIISMRSNVRKWTHVLLVYTSWSHLRSWREQCPSNWGNLNFNVTENVYRIRYTGAHLLLVLFFVNNCFGVAF
jgi:hypothetical protein